MTSCTHRPAAGRTNRRRLLQALACAAAVPLAGCTRPTPPLKVGSIVFATYEYAFLARELGWVDERDTRLVELPANSYSLRALASGQIDAAQLTLDEVITGRASGVDLVVVHVLDVSAGSDAVYARPGITLDRLAGRRVALESGAVGALMLDGLLRAARLRADQVQRVPITLGRSAEAWRDRGIDLVVTAEPWATQIGNEGGVRIFDSKAMPGLIVDVVAVRRDALTRHAGALRLLVDGIVRARAFHGQSPTEAARRLAPRLRVDPAEVEQAFRGLQIPDPEEARRMLARDGQLMTSARNLVRVMRESGMLRDDIPVERLVGGLVEPAFLQGREAA